MGFKVLNLIFLSLFLPAVAAQEFVPPAPPPLDPATDFEDMEEDMMEMGDEGFRPPPPPPPPPPQNTQGPPPPDNRPAATGTAFGNQNAKVKFKLVEGEYWEKGKKRTRGKKMR